MKKQRIFRFSAFALALVSTGAFSSCNRGYGCPTNFSIDGTLEAVVNSVLLFF